MIDVLACGIILICYSAILFFAFVGSSSAESAANWQGFITALVAGIGMVVHVRKHSKSDREQ